MRKSNRKTISLTAVALVLSVFTSVAFHIPFFRLVLERIEGGLNGVLITGGLAVIMLALNFFFYCLLLYSGRFIGKCIVAFSFIADAVSLYFINTYEVLITDKMMGNVFNTQYSEASGFFSISAILYIVLLGILPCIYVFTRKSHRFYISDYLRRTWFCWLCFIITFLNLCLRRSIVYNRQSFWSRTGSKPVHICRCGHR